MANTSRRLLFAGAGALALAAGAGTAWWWRGHDGAAPVTGTEPAATDTGEPRSGEEAALAQLWAQRFAQPDGGELAMASLRGRPLLINFWATWCAPCIRELPALQRWHQARGQGPGSKGAQVLALAIDGAEPVRAFVQRTQLQLPVALAGIEGTSLVRALGNAQGGLPFSVLIGADGRIIERKLGELTEADLAAWAQLG